jgi:hypothetical protein
VLCCAVLCCAVLCCAVLCCAVLCCAVLCCAVLVLCCAVLSSGALTRAYCGCSSIVGGVGSVGSVVLGGGLASVAGAGTSPRSVSSMSSGQANVGICLSMMLETNTIAGACCERTLVPSLPLHPRRPHVTPTHHPTFAHHRLISTLDHHVCCSPVPWG